MESGRAAPLWGLVLILSISITPTKSDTALRIYRHADDNYVPITSRVVRGRAGLDLELSCELYSDASSNRVLDDRISWGRAPRLGRGDDLASAVKRGRDSYLRPSDVNKAVKRFAPLRAADAGLYFCVSFKYGLVEVVRVHVDDDADDAAEQRFPMNAFEYKDATCVGMNCNGVCIMQRYVCDGKKDCQDGSDESYERCNGDPCRDKIPCDDRCVPKYWCCDPHLDSNCNVTFRPPCCPSEVMEYTYNVTQPKQRHSDFIFIAFCIFVMIVILVGVFVLMSKMFLLVNKQAFGGGGGAGAARACRNRGRPLLRDSVLRYPAASAAERSDDDGRARDPEAARHHRADALDRLLGDRPPAYAEVEPPPPYASRERLDHGR